MPRFTQDQLPAGWRPLKGELDALQSDRPASLDGAFVAGFNDDGSLKFYAFLQRDVDPDGCALELEPGREKGRACVDGVTEYYENGGFYAVGNGFEERPHDCRPCAFEEWVWRSLAAIEKSAVLARPRS